MRSLIAIEYEIKISRSDFLADAKKRVKHSRLKHANVLRPWGSSRFKYVLPAGMCKEGELPDYAGLIEYEKRDTLFDGTCRIDLKEIKRGPLLHKQAIDQHTILSLAKRLMWRYWNDSGIPNDPAFALFPERYSS